MNPIKPATFARNKLHVMKYFPLLLTAFSLLLTAALSGFSIEAQAQTVVLSDNFDSYALGTFGSAYNFGDSGATPSSTIIAPGAGGSGQALQLSANLHSGTNANTGVNLPAYSPTGNTSPNLSDYTLSFDLALSGVNPGNFYVALNIFGNNSDGVEYDIGSGSLPSAGSGYKHFSINLSTLPHAYNVALLNPTDSGYSFQLVLLGFPPNVTATPETVLLDNIQVSMVATTNVAGPNYVNPPIYADYPDPDIIRVGSDFYFSTTTFIDVPGLTILHSRDLVHWEIVTHLVPSLTGSPNYNITNGVQNYGNGVFASSLRYYNGTFYCAETQNGQSTRIYYSTNIAGPWQYNQLSVGAFDPGLYIETNGTAYIASAGGWQSNTTFYTLNPTLSSVVATHVITNGLGLEGSHVVKRGAYYYIFNAQPSTESLYISRATNLFGPYTFMKSLDDGHGGHQGAIVDMPDGSDYGFVMKDSGTIGRMTYISPIFWSNSWPIWGTTNAPGRVPVTAPTPIAGAPAYSIPTSDDFSSPTLNMQWQWNHNPDNSRWSLTERPGFLRLHPTGATNFWYARNTLIQKGQGPYSSAEVKFDLTHLQPGDTCGLAALGKTNGTIAVTCNSPGNYSLSLNVIVSSDSTKTNLVTTTVATASYTSTTIFLRLGMDFIKSTATVRYCTDGLNWTQLGGQFNIAYDWLTGTFQGEQFAIFCFNPQPGAGYLDVDWFRFSPPPFIAGIVPRSGPGTALYFENSPNSTNILQATDVLAPAPIWQNISTNTADSTGLWQFTDSNVGLHPTRLYRIRYQNPGN
jgi:beta-xylosidase